MNRRTLEWRIFNSELQGTVWLDASLTPEREHGEFLEAVSKATGLVSKMEIVRYGRILSPDQPLPDSVVVIAESIQNLIGQLQTIKTFPDERNHVRAVIYLGCVEMRTRSVPSENSSRLKFAVRERRVVAKIVHETRARLILKLDSPRQLNHGFGPTVPSHYFTASLDGERRTKDGFPAYPIYVDHPYAEKSFVNGWCPEVAYPEMFTVRWKPCVEVCVVCLDRASCVVSSDCDGHHYVACDECSKNLTSCPSCRGTLRSTFVARSWDVACDESTP